MERRVDEKWTWCTDDECTCPYCAESDITYDELSIDACEVMECGSHTVFCPRCDEPFQLQIERVGIEMSTYTLAEAEKMHMTVNHEFVQRKKASRATKKGGE